MWVSPFRYPRIYRHLPLPAAFRSLSRLSSALSAKASALRPFLLNPSSPPSIAAASLPRIALRLRLASLSLFLFPALLFRSHSHGYGLGCPIRYRLSL